MRICRLWWPLHAWGSWRAYRERRVRVEAGLRHEVYSARQARKCARCGLEQDIAVTA